VVVVAFPIITRSTVLTNSPISIGVGLDLARGAVLPSSALHRVVLTIMRRIRRRVPVQRTLMDSNRNLRIFPTEVPHYHGHNHRSPKDLRGVTHSASSPKQSEVREGVQREASARERYGTCKYLMLPARLIRLAADCVTHPTRRCILCVAHPTRRCSANKS
jgi:hypothetical protein